MTDQTQSRAARQRPTGPNPLDHPDFDCLWRAAESYSATRRIESCPG